MAILLDGQRKVTYKAPRAATTPVRYKSATSMLNKTQQASANRYQAQANQAQQPKQVQRPPTPTAAQKEMESWYGQGKNAQNAYAQSLQAQANMYKQGNTKPTTQQQGGTTPGGASWSMGLPNYKPAPDYREKYADILMSQDEYIKRMNTWNKMYQSGYKSWIDRAAQTPNQAHDVFSQWYQNNPKPAGFLATYDEWNKRNMAAPAGYMWQPFGTGYAKLNTAPTPTNTPTDYSGGSYASNYPNYSGGGGGGGGTYTPKPPEWWVEMVQWRI